MKIAVGSRARLVDEAVDFVIEGGSPGERVVVRAHSEIAGAVFVAEATFEADADGRVEPARQASVAGSYTGVDPFGLWWSGRPSGPSTASPVAPVRSRIVAEGDSARAEAIVERRWLAEGVRVVQVAEPGVRGMFAVPAGPGPFPAVVAFGGSAGGLGPAAAWTPILASRGFATLAIAYFAAPGLPQALAEIEVEVVERALAWLSTRPEVKGGPVTVMGQSRGAELALLAGSLLDGVGAVVVFAPSGVVWAGLGPSGPVDRSAWTFRGQPLPHVGLRQERSSSSAPVALAPMFHEAMRDAAALRAAEIPVERIRGAILAVSGDDDAMWPSVALTEVAAARLAAHGRPPLTHLHYADAGHVAGGTTGTPVSTEVKHPLDGGHYAFGGSRAGNAAARAASWPRVLGFLAART